jgi:hypothetical protein
MKNKRVIQTDADFQNSIYFQTQLQVWIQGEQENETIIIESFDDNVVRFKNGNYIKHNCMFIKT